MDQSAPDEAKDETKSEAKPAADGKIDISFSSGLAGFLRQQGVALAFTSYQAGGLYLIGHDADGKLALHQAGYHHAMGVAGDGNRLYLGRATEIVRLENVLAANQMVNGVHDKAYVTRNIQVLGGIDIHEIGVRQNGVIVFVNTRYSCLCEPSRTHSFKPIWKPSFISKLAPEDRCHLNGLAMKAGAPKYVTAISRADVVDGWRDRREQGGIVIDVETDAIVAEGLSMPHSPRVYDGRLWVLNSGSGELGHIHLKSGAFEPVAFCPGFLRGLAFRDGHAIVTLSKPRYKRFDGLALADRLAEKDAEAWCGVQIVSLATGDVVHWLRFDGALAELFDVCVLPGVRNPLTVAANSKEIRDFLTFEPPAWATDGPRPEQGGDGHV